MSHSLQHSIQTGDVIAGKYRVDRVLGSGGMGTVVAAMHLDLDELRAVKLMHPHQLDNEQAVKRFIQEARATVRLKSDHIPRLFDVGRLESGAPYIVMEVLQGADMRTMLKSRGPLPIEEAVLYILQACEAIAEAHAAGIIHRDLKPANLFMTTRPDGSPCVKVLDFGISKLLFDPSRAAGADMTKTLDVLGSIHYMAPEQLRSSRDVDARADVWSLGVILYRLLTGRLPFQGDTPVAYIMALRDPLHPPSAFRSDLPPELDAVIMRSLEKDPSKRTGSVAELMIGLIPFGEGGNGPRVLPASESNETLDEGDYEDASDYQEANTYDEANSYDGTNTYDEIDVDAQVAPSPSMEGYDDVDSLDLNMSSQPAPSTTLGGAPAPVDFATAPFVLIARDPMADPAASASMGAPAEAQEEPLPVSDTAVSRSEDEEEPAPQVAAPPPQPPPRKQARRPQKPLSLSVFILLGCLLGAVAGMIIAVVIVTVRRDPGLDVAAPGPPVATAPPATPVLVAAPAVTTAEPAPTAPPAAPIESAAAPSLEVAGAPPALTGAPVANVAPTAPPAVTQQSQQAPGHTPIARVPGGAGRKGPSAPSTAPSKPPTVEPPRPGPIFE